MLKLGVVGEITKLVVDTNHFKGNFPESVSVDVCLCPEAKAQVTEAKRLRPGLSRKLRGDGRMGEGAVSERDLGSSAGWVW